MFYIVDQRLLVQTCPVREDAHWYDAILIGKNKLASMVADMCNDAQNPHRTNHSLRATGASCYFKAMFLKK